MTHAELVRRLSAAEMVEWVAFYRLEAQEMAARLKPKGQRPGTAGGS